jgi:hypothetical protein
LVGAAYRGLKPAANPKGNAANPKGNAATPKGNAANPKGNADDSCFSSSCEARG